jgi:hypothetical protein
VKLTHISDNGLILRIIGIILFIIMAYLPVQLFAQTISDGILNDRRHDLLSSQSTGQQQQPLNYTDLGKSLGCTDLNTNSPHAVNIGKILNCNNR